MFSITSNQLSAEALTLTGEDVTRGSLILVNREYPLKKPPAPGSLVSLSGLPFCDLRLPQPVFLEKQAATMLSTLLNSIGCAFRITGVSGFRPRNEQTALWERTLRLEGEAFANAYVARPGHSEHETGLAIDLAASAPDIDFVRPDFPDTGICSIFRQKAAHFGFIERYPAGKEAITGIHCEPWHFRYVGFPHSALMVREQLTLEEYLELLEQNSSPLKPYCYTAQGTRMELMYIPITNHRGISLEFSDSLPFTVSGTNKEGVILTRFRRLYDHPIV